MSPSTRLHLPSKWKSSNLESLIKLLIRSTCLCLESIRRLLQLLSKDMQVLFFLSTAPNLGEAKNQFNLLQEWLSTGFNGKVKALECLQLASKLKKKKLLQQKEQKNKLTTNSSTISKTQEFHIKLEKKKSMVICPKGMVLFFRLLTSNQLGIFF